MRVTVFACEAEAPIHLGCLLTSGSTSWPCIRPAPVRFVERRFWVSECRLRRWQLKLFAPAANSHFPPNTVVCHSAAFVGFGNWGDNVAWRTSSDRTRLFTRCRAPTWGKEAHQPANHLKSLVNWAGYGGEGVVYWPRDTEYVLITLLFGRNDLQPFRNLHRQRFDDVELAPLKEPANQIAYMLMNK